MAVSWQDVEGLDPCSGIVTVEAVAGWLGGAATHRRGQRGCHSGLGELLASAGLLPVELGRNQSPGDLGKRKFEQ